MVSEVTLGFVQRLITEIRVSWTVEEVIGVMWVVAADVVDKYILNNKFYLTIVAINMIQY